MEMKNFDDTTVEEINTNRCLIGQDDIENHVDNVQAEIANNPQLWFPGEEEEYNVSYIYIFN